LPFQNMSGDPEQEYFAYGIVEEIITALSRFRHLFVIARNSTFTYKGRAVDVKQVGRELGVRYVLEGGVRKAGDRVRITAQLVDALTGAHLWADRFDGALDDIFGLQDRVTASVVGAIAPKLEQVEINRATRKPTESLDAYDYYLRGIAIFDQYTREATDEALQLFYRAIELDPGFASAHGLAAWCYLRRKNYGWMTEPLQELAEAERVARRAVELGKDDAVALCSGGYVLARLGHSLHASAALIDRALNLNSNLARGWFLSGWVRNYLGEPEVAIEHFTRAIRLNPLDPLIFGMQTGIAAAHFLARRYDESSSWAERAILEHSNYLPALRMAAASHALAGRLEAAQQAMARMRQADPNLRISTLTELLPFRGPEDCARYEEGLRKAGLPE
jgi:TolB-like protein/Tfp pilus assembly protein PilF